MQVLQQVINIIISPLDLSNKGLLRSIVFDYSREGLRLLSNSKDASNQ